MDLGALFDWFGVGMWAGSAADAAGDYAYGAKDAVQGKAADLNNATDDSETYTQKAANTAYAAKNKAADMLGLNQPSTGPSLLDQAKGYVGVGTDTTKDNAQSAVDTTNDYAGQAKDTTQDYAQSAADTTKDYAGSAADTTRDTVNQPSTGNPSLLDQAKGYLGVAADKTNNTAQDATDTTNDYAGSATDTSKDVAGSAADTTNDYAGKLFWKFSSCLVIWYVELGVNWRLGFLWQVQLLIPARIMLEVLMIHRLSMRKLHRTRLLWQPNKLLMWARTTLEALMILQLSMHR
jgi:hypothetical protein